MLNLADIVNESIKPLKSVFNTDRTEIETERLDSTKMWEYKGAIYEEVDKGLSEEELKNPNVVPTYTKRYKPIVASDGTEVLVDYPYTVHATSKGIERALDIIKEYIEKEGK